MLLHQNIRKTTIPDPGQSERIGLEVLPHPCFLDEFFARPGRAVTAAGRPSARHGQQRAYGSQHCHARVETAVELGMSDRCGYDILRSHTTSVIILKRVYR